MYNKNFKLIKLANINKNNTNPQNIVGIMLLVNIYNQNKLSKNFIRCDTA